jgi:hypothetical protein
MHLRADEKSGQRVLSDDKCKYIYIYVCVSVDVHVQARLGALVGRVCRGSDGLVQIAHKEVVVVKEVSCGMSDSHQPHTTRRKQWLFLVAAGKRASLRFEYTYQPGRRRPGSARLRRTQTLRCFPAGSRHICQPGRAAPRPDQRHESPQVYRTRVCKEDTSTCTRMHKRTRTSTHADAHAHTGTHTHTFRAPCMHNYAPARLAAETRAGHRPRCAACVQPR